MYLGMERAQGHAQCGHCSQGELPLPQGQQHSLGTGSTGLCWGWHQAQPLHFPVVLVQVRLPLEDTGGGGNITESFPSSSRGKFDSWKKGKFVSCGDTSLISGEVFAV